MSTTRIINKYPNRRLYDTEISRYITLEEVRQLVLTGEDFRIIDKRTKKDITRSILLQVIAEQEEGGDPIFTSEVLTQVIRFYGDSMQGTMSSYLELSLQLFNEQQSQFRDQLRNLVGNNPMKVLHELSQQNMPLWKSVRREFLRNLSSATHSGDRSSRDINKTSPNEEPESADTVKVTRNHGRRKTRS